MDHALDLVLEIPRGSRNTYEHDHELGVMRPDRHLFPATVYPADHGFVPGPLADDGDPLEPRFAGIEACRARFAAADGHR